MALTKYFLVCISIAFLQVSYAKPKLQSVQQLAGLYLLQKEAEVQAQNFSQEHCQPTAPSRECTDFVAGSFATQEQKIAAVRACVGNSGDECVKWAAGQWATFEQKLAAAQACKYNQSLDCSSYVAGSWATIEQKTMAARACASADVECVKQIAGSFATFEQKVEAAKACSGQP